MTTQTPNKKQLCFSRRETEIPPSNNCKTQHNNTESIQQNMKNHKKLNIKTLTKNNHKSPAKANKNKHVDAPCNPTILIAAGLLATLPPQQILRSEVWKTLSNYSPSELCSCVLTRRYMSHVLNTCLEWVEGRFEPCRAGNSKRRR